MFLSWLGMLWTKFGPRMWFNYNAPFSYVLHYSKENHDLQEQLHHGKLNNKKYLSSSFCFILWPKFLSCDVVFTDCLSNSLEMIWKSVKQGYSYKVMCPKTTCLSQIQHACLKNDMPGPRTICLS